MDVSEASRPISRDAHHIGNGHRLRAGRILAFSTAPPRLLSRAEFVDTLRYYGGWGWWGSADSLPSGAKSIGNQFAAMPSLHVAWSLWCAWVVGRYAQRSWIRGVAWCYPAITTLVVLLTANHYVLDALVGALLWAAVTLLCTVIGPRVLTRLSHAFAEQRCGRGSRPPAASIGSVA